MAASGRSDDLRGADFVGVDLRGARFRDADLSGVVMRGVDVRGADIDAPWLMDGGSLHVNGVDVIPLVEEELCRRFPGRAERRAEDPVGLRSALGDIGKHVGGDLERVAAMPRGTVDVSVDGEWSFAQTLRHLVMAADMWLGRAILGIERPFHPAGQVDSGTAAGGFDVSILTNTAPSFGEVLLAREGRVEMVREFLASVSADTLSSIRPNPHAPEHRETVLSCLHTILDEEWEHLRYAVRDLDEIEARRGRAGTKKHPGP